MLKSKKFWSFDVCEQVKLSDEVLSNFKQKGKFYEDALYFYDQIGTGVHPSIKVFHGTTPTVITFNNVLVDNNTIKILFHLINSSKIVKMKFSSNNFTIENLDFLINSLLNKPNEVYDFTFEWNDKITVDKQVYSFQNVEEITDEIIVNQFKKQHEILLNLFINPNKLESICLRGNFLGDEIANLIFENLKNENTNLRILNLFKNNLTSECIKKFSEMLKVNKKLEEINFGGNYLTNETLELIKQNYGMWLLNEEELEEFKKLEKEKQDIIKQNAKLKAAKKPELEVPELDNLEEIDGKNYRCKNHTLRVINVIQNNFDENSFDNLKYLLDSNVNLVFTGDLLSYNEEQRKILNEEVNEEGKFKYKDRIYLLK